MIYSIKSKTIAILSSCFYFCYWTSFPLFFNISLVVSNSVQTGNVYGVSRCILGTRAFPRPGHRQGVGGIRPSTLVRALSTNNHVQQWSSRYGGAAHRRRNGKPTSTESRLQRVRLQRAYCYNKEILWWTVVTITVCNKQFPLLLITQYKLEPV